MTTHYQTLGIPKEASAERVKRSYRSLVKTCHPDQFPSGSQAQAAAEERIREINAAYAVLSKPRKRASYDAELNKQASNHPHPEPEHCDKCGKPTGYWHRDRNGALCHACTGTAP
jgi:curved DNA-binding protein CbpA